MSRLFSIQFPISKGDQRHLTILFEIGTFPWTCALTVTMSKRQKVAPPRTIIAWQRAVGGILPTRNLPTVTFMQSITLWGSFAPGLGLMDAAYVLTIFRTGKHSGSTFAASMVLVWKYAMDVRIQRPSSFDLCKYQFC